MLAASLKPPRQPRRRVARNRAVVAIVSLGLVSLVSGCSGGGNGAYAYQCPDGHLVQLSILDLSSSGRAEQLLADRLNAIQIDAERVTDCEGSLKVVAWSMSSADSVTLFSGDLATKGATEIGRDRKIAGVVKGVMEDVRAQIESALGSIDPSGSDLSGALSIAADGRAALGDDDSFEVHIYGDGVSTTGSVAINDPSMTADRVDALVAAWSPVDLMEATVTFYGIGKVGGVAQAPQDYIAVVRRYATALCEATGATCVALTSLPQ